MFSYMLCKMVMTAFIVKMRLPSLREVKGLKATEVRNGKAVAMRGDLLQDLRNQVLEPERQEPNAQLCYLPVELGMNYFISLISQPKYGHNYHISFINIIMMIK